MMTLRIAAVIGVLACTADAPHAAGAEWPAFGDWQVAVLPAAGGCAATQAVVGRASGAILLRAVLVQRPAGGADMFLQVPTGADLARGIAYRHPGGAEALALDWQSCDAAFCTAHRALDGRQLDGLRAAARVEVGFRPLPESQILNLPLSLRGVTAALTHAGTCLSGDQE